MAAKPPKPPGNFLKNLLNVNNNNININNNINEEEENPNKETKTSITTSAASAVAALNSNSTCANAGDDSCNNLPSNTTTTPTKKSNCNCTNITIMHLFHEMKQEFPTIPDTIVTQCVNENCHQRENCIQMLKSELELNPIPVQSYPAKVLHPQIHHQNNYNNNNNNINNSHHNTTTPSIGSTLGGGSPLKPPLHQKPLMQQKHPLKPPLKPVRPAPLQPPPRKSSLGSTNSPVPNRKTNQSTPNPLQSSSSSIRNLLSVDVPSGDSHTNEENLNDMPATTTTGIHQTQAQSQANSTHHNGEELNNNNKKWSGVNETNAVVGNLPRARPTTLNLNVQQQQQQQQRQRLNVQLQEHFQQQRRQQQQPPPQQQQQQQQTITGSSVINKPLRKAPLPPIAPKPIVFHHPNNNIAGGGESSVVVSPQSESEISANLTLSTPSPTSSTASSSLTTPRTHHTQQHLQNKSPMRHRSVITLQPEPPYTRDFLLSQATAATQTPTTAGSSIVSSPTNSVHSGTSQKSYTSVNLTLRPPTTVLNSALQPSAIDITAGPGFSGASGGGKSLSYSSTSYDARLGYQQNFHITVTDEGGVFSASRRRAQGQRNLNQVNICKNEYDGNSDGDNKSNNCHSLYDEQQQQQQLLQLQQQQQQQLLQQQFHNTDAVALRQPNWQQNYNHNNSPLQGINCSSGFGSMCLAPQQSEEDDFVTETLERQKKRRDRLAGALRENKKRLSQVEHEVNLITGPIPEGLSERLDVEIQKLRAECQAMLRSSNPLTQQPRTQQQQFPPQPFPRQRSAKPPPRPPSTATAAVATMPRQTSLDIIQHHTTATPTSLAGSPHTHASLPNFPNTLSPTMVSSPQQQQQLQHSHSISPSLYQQQQQQQQQQAYHQTPHYFATANNGMPDDEPPSYYSDQDAGDYDDDDEDTEEYEVVEHWECNMCTFRNHPQLNICECCDNVRILPGTLTNLSRALSANSATSATGSVGGGLTSVTNGSVTDINAAVAASAVTSSGGTMNTSGASGNLEHETNLAQQQMQHLALHI